MIVAVDARPERGTQARIWSEDRTIDMLVPIDYVRRRLVGSEGPIDFWFFHATLKHDILELGEPAHPKHFFDVSAVFKKPEPYKPHKALAEGPELCPCGARQHKGLCARALERERREKGGEGYGTTYGY